MPFKKPPTKEERKALGIKEGYQPVPAGSLVMSTRENCWSNCVVFQVVGHDGNDLECIRNLDAERYIPMILGPEDYKVIQRAES